jgi:hypothetical protein
VYDAFQRKLDATNRRYALAIQEAVLPDRPVTDAHARVLAQGARRDRGRRIARAQDDASRRS